ncbi:unnamed protein product [Arabis nemorensis]|uniref:Uncharacterized protein n=1 Tax=Arabis nemorensis TaxID=586526 RepID=A0A565BDB9_9BRAS|nr:unnamed protein product [Arabis nemorensis]
MNQVYKVGIASHGENPAMVTLSIEKKCLIVHLVETMQNGPIQGRFADFLANDSIGFVSSGPLTMGALALHGYSDALQPDDVDEEEPTFADLAELVVGSRIELDPVVAAGDWTVWPLTNDQVLLTST